MKYLKVTFGLFVATFLLTAFNVNAAEGVATTLTKVQVPKLQGTYSGPKVGKVKDSMQIIWQSTAYYNTNKRPKADVLARVKGLTSGLTTTSWVTTKQQKNVELGSDSQGLGSWQIQLKAAKRDNNSISYFGAWIYDQ